MIEFGQIVVILMFCNNVFGGIGNDFVLDNIAFCFCGFEVFIFLEEIENICEDGSFIFLNVIVVGD